LRLLFASDVYPSPLDRGDRVRVRRLLEACARAFEVTFIGPRPHDNIIDDLLGSGIRFIFFERQSRFWNPRMLIRGMRTSIGIPTKMLVYRINFLKALDRVDVGKFDLIWAERPHIGRLFAQYREKTIVDFDDITHIRMKRRFQLQKPSIGLIGNFYSYAVYRFAEVHLFRKYLGVLVCSEEDRQYLLAKRSGNVFVVPNGVDIRAENPNTDSPIRGGKLRLVFLGNMEHPANVDAIRYFSTEILPHAKSFVESLDVIGPKTPKSLEDELAKHVRFLGFQDNLGECLRQYDAMIAPIRFGSGTKLKVLEGMASGIPLVISSCAAEGLELTNGTHALIADAPQEIVAALSALVNSPQLGMNLASAAKELAIQRFSWAAIQSALEGRLKELVSSVPEGFEAQSKTVSD
jgi:glycosyltransferase involved in cell wall biosynthesis